MVEFDFKQEVVGWGCSDCEWEYRLETPLRREHVAFDIRSSAELLHHGHDCNQYRKKIVSR
jgi:hypothetical protein